MSEISPIWIPIVGMLIPIVAILGGIYSQVQARRSKDTLRMALIQRGASAAEIESFLRGTASETPAYPAKDPMRSLGNARRAAIVLISVGLGLILFFAILEMIVGEREVLAGAACGVIPMMIGIGFIVDYQLQKRDLARFGVADADSLRE